MKDAKTEFSKMNKGKSVRTLTENVFLQEMIQEDVENILDEERAVDVIIPNENPDGVFSDSEEPLEDTIGSNVDSEELETMNIDSLF